MGIESAAQHEWLMANGELIVTWPAAPFEQTDTHGFKVSDDYWIWQQGVGGISFSEHQPHVIAYPSLEVDRAWFDHLVNRSWLPAVYQFWGRQVLHATAVAVEATGWVAAFAGPTLAGKSTIAYGLGRRPGWRLVCDDTLVFSSDNSTITLHRFRNDARLRPESAAFYGKTGAVAEALEWPAYALRLGVIYVLDGVSDRLGSALITRLKAHESYPLLLEQAHALTLNFPRHNQLLMRDYLQLASAVPVFRLVYRKSFDALEETLDAVARHIHSLGDSFPRR